MAHLHPVYDTDPHFLVDSTSRIISYSSKEKLLLVQGDHNCQRYTFEMPRYIDGHDMKLCDRVEVHYTNIDSRNERGKSYGLYKVTDMQISTNDENVLVFSWLISRLATVYAGVTNFTIRFSCTTNGEIDYVWSTGVYTSVVIASTIDNEENVIGQYYENLIPENIREGVEIGGVEGTLKADFIYQDKDITLTNEGTVEVTADDGKLLSKEWFRSADYFNKDGFVRVQRTNGKWNFIDKDGKILSDEWFDWVDYFYDGFAKVRRTNGERAKIDKTGKLIKILQ